MDHHGHGGGGHSCEHDHGEQGDGAEGLAEEWGLYREVDTTRLSCLNEAEPDSLKRVLRPWDQRTDTSLPLLTSDADEQLLMCIPFTSPVKIRSICVIGAGGPENPAAMKAFVNHESMDFSSADTTRAVQEWQLVERNPMGDVHYPTKYTKFQNVSVLWLYVTSNFGADVTKIQYIGLRGSSTKYRREAVKTAYEVQPTASTREIRGESNFPRMGM